VDLRLKADPISSQEDLNDTHRTEHLLIISFGRLRGYCRRYSIYRGKLHFKVARLQLHNFVKWGRYEIRQTWTRNICIKLLKLNDSLCGAKNGHKGIPFCRIVVSVHARISTHLACRRTSFTVRRLKLIAHTRTSALLKGIITAQAILFRFVLLYSTVKLSDLVIQGV